MRAHIGIQPFFNPRQDGAEQYEITQALCDEYQKMEDRQFKGITEFDRMYTYGLFGTNDTLVDCREEYSIYYTKATQFAGEHRLKFEDVRDVVVKLVEELLKD